VQREVVGTLAAVAGEAAAGVVGPVAAAAVAVDASSPSTALAMDARNAGIALPTAHTRRIFDAV
jgi:hypothetical protein